MSDMPATPGTYAVFNTDDGESWTAYRTVDALLADVTGQSWQTPKTMPYRCLDRLTNPRHRCSHDLRPVHLGHWYDHTTWRYRSLDGRPHQWVLVTQPYPGPWHLDLNNTFSPTGCHVTILSPGGGPYSPATATVIVIGATDMPDLVAGQATRPRHSALDEPR